MGAKAQVIVGLIGQVCAGKSAVAEAFRRRGARVYDADQNVHAIYRMPEVIAEVRQMFGEGVIDGQGQVDRKALGRIVFSDAAKLKRLTEKVIFPRTGIAMNQEIEKLRTFKEPALVLDAPTLIEAGRDGLCDALVFIEAPLARRQEWAKKRGWEPGELERREARMMNEDMKRKASKMVISNAGTPEDLDRQVGVVFDTLTGREHLNS